MWASCGSVENPPESEHGWHARASGVRRDGREWPGHKFGVAGAKTGLFRPRPGGSIRLPADPQLTLWAIVLRSYGAGSGAIRGSTFMPHGPAGTRGGRMAPWRNRSRSPAPPAATESPRGAILVSTFMPHGPAGTRGGRMAPWRNGSRSPAPPAATESPRGAILVSTFMPRARVDFPHMVADGRREQAPRPASPFEPLKEDGHRQSRDQGMRRANPRWLLCSRASPIASLWPEIGLGETYRLRRC